MHPQHSINDPQKNSSPWKTRWNTASRGIRQTQVNPKAGLTFATASAYPAPGPDIVMVGEIRMRKTASTAVRPLDRPPGLSTLHTNDARDLDSLK